jgi:hypothetical protein
MRWLVPVVLLLLVAGCGGGGPDSKPPLTKAQFVVQGDELCNEFRQSHPATVAAKNWPSLREGSEAAARAEDGFADDFAALDAPAGGRAVHDHFVATERRAARITRKIADLAATPTRTSRAEIDAYVRQIHALGEAIRAELRGYGFKVCGLPRST